MIPTAGPSDPSRIVREVLQVRSEYTSARDICSNLEARLSRTLWARHRGYAPPEVDYLTADGRRHSTRVRDCDVRYLDRVPAARAVEHAGLIHGARRGDPEALQALERRTQETFLKISARFAGQPLLDNAHVTPYTTQGPLSEALHSHKGSILLDLSRRGFATADFSLLTSAAYELSGEALEACARDAIRNLEILSGRRLDDPENPLLVAVRSAMPEYIPGFMPTYLNVGLTPRVLFGLPRRYGPEAAVRIRLNNRKTLLEVVDPEAFQELEKERLPGLGTEEIRALAGRIEDRLEGLAPGLLSDALAQVMLCLSGAYRYYRDHRDVLANFAGRETHRPAVIMQRMVCSVIDRESYAGVLYSRHPRLGSGVFLQFARTVFGEDLMTGRLQPEERHFHGRAETREEFPAVYHFWDRLFQLEDVFRGPVMVEFTGVHGTFTVLQVNAAELAGTGMLTAVMDMHRTGLIPAGRVRELIQPYHVRQVESDAIDPRSLEALEPFARGVAVLPRSAVSGRVYFSAAHVRDGRDESGAPVILVKERFTPQDAVEMQGVAGICSLSPAAIHVVTTAQNLGIPALLNLEEQGLRLDREARRLVNAEGRELREGDWVTISSRMKTLFIGRAVFAPARLLRFMAGESLPLSPPERERFEGLAEAYRAFRRITESVGAAEFKSLQDLGRAIRYGELRDRPERALDFVNRAFDLDPGGMARHLLEVSLGTHLINQTAFRLLSPERRLRLLKEAAAQGRERHLSGYEAGAFVLGCLVEPASPADFWRRLEPAESAYLLNEWVLHQKYLSVLDDVGPRKVRLARQIVRSRGLSGAPLPPGAAAEFIRLKLSGVDLDRVQAALPGDSDPGTGELLAGLKQPYSAFFDFSSPESLAGLEKICREEGLPRPDRDDR
jgi:hypothetical protein